MRPYKDLTTSFGLLDPSPLLTFCEHERLAELKKGDILVMFGLDVVLGVLRLAADSVAHLSVFPSPVVVPGPDSDILGRGI